MTPAFLQRENKKELSELNTFEPRKPTIYLFFLIIKSVNHSLPGKSRWDRSTMKEKEGIRGWPAAGAEVTSYRPE